MGRKKMSENGTKEKIVIAALKIFSEKGYEETSVRMILEEADAVVGSFYHYFKSKEEVFEAAIEYYLETYAYRISQIVNDETKTFFETLELILDEVELGSIQYRNKMQADKLHWTLQYAFHMRTMQQIQPCIQKLIERAIANGIAQNVLNMDSVTLSAVLLNGIEGILHSRPMEVLTEEDVKRLKQLIVEYVSFILGMHDK